MTNGGEVNANESLPRAALEAMISPPYPEDPAGLAEIFGRFLRLQTRTIYAGDRRFTVQDVKAAQQTDVQHRHRQSYHVSGLKSSVPSLRLCDLATPCLSGLDQSLPMWTVMLPSLMGWSNPLS